MPIHDELGTRMKEFYESVPKTKLMRRTPVAIRIDLWVDWPFEINDCEIDSLDWSGVFIDDELNDIEKSMAIIQQFIEQEEK